MKKIIVFSALALLISIPFLLFTQDDSMVRRDFNLAESLETVDDFTGSLKLFLTLVKEDPDNANFNFRLANAIISGKSQMDPLPYLEKAAKGVNRKAYKSNYKNRFAPEQTWSLLSREYHRSMQFTKALSVYDSVLKYADKRNAVLIAEINGYKANCLSGIELKKHPVKVNHLDFPPLARNNLSAHSPLFSPDESVFLFTVSEVVVQTDLNPGEEPAGTDDNIYSMEVVKGKWSTPKLLSSNISSTRNEAAIGTSPDGNTLLIYREDFGDGNIYYCELLDNKVWSRPKKFPSPINSSALESNATLSADGSIIYFTSDRKGGFGGMDIYMSKKSINGKWGDAINLGPEINTKWHEECPHLQAFSNIFYFCSNRPESIGGFDIFRCELQENSHITKLVNLGYPINTADNELFFKTSVDGHKGYFSSNCKSNFGELDLVIVEFLDAKLFPNVTVKGVVVDFLSDTLRNSEVSLFNINQRDITDSTITDPANGDFFFNLHSQNRYFASFHYKGWVYFSKPFEIEKYYTDNSFSTLIELDPIILDDSSMRQSLSEFLVMKRDLKRRKEGKVPAGDITSGDALFEVITNQKGVKFTKKFANLNPLARRLEDLNRYAVTKDAKSVIPQLDRITDLDMPIVNINAPAMEHGTEYDRTKVMADSLKRLGIRHFETAEYTDAIENLEQALNLYEDLGLTEDMIVSANYLAKSLTESGRIDEAIPPHLLALALLRQLNDTKAIGDKEYEIGIAYDLLYNKINAESYLQQSVQTRKSDNDLDGQIASVSGLVTMYDRHSDYANMITSLDELLRLTKLKGNKSEIASVLNQLGLAYNNVEDFDRAMNYFNQSVSVAEGIDDRKALSIYLNNIGNSYFTQKKYGKALEFYQRSLEIKREIAYQTGEALTLYNMGNTHYRLKNMDIAMELLTASMALSSKLKEDDLIAQNHFSLMQVHQFLQQYEQALSHYQEYIKIRVPGYNDNDTQYAQDNSKYELSQKDISILKRKMYKQELFAKLELQKRQNELDELDRNNQEAKQIQYGVLIGTVGFLIVFFLIYRRFKDRQNLNNQLKIKNQLILNQKDQIVKQKSMLETVNTQLEKLSIVASETCNAVTICDGKGNVEWVNNAFISIYGKNVADLNTLPEMSIFNIHSDQQSQEYISEALKNKEATNFEAIKHVMPGCNAWIQSSITPIYADEALFKIIIIDSDINAIKEKEHEIALQRDHISLQRDEIEKQRDIALAQKDEIEAQAEALQETIDELQNTQRKLIESEKMASLGNLVAGVAHEINTPVGIGIAAASTFKSKTANLERLFSSKQMKQSDLSSYLVSAKEATKLLTVNLNRTGDLVKSFKQVSVDEITEQHRTFDFKEYLQDVLISLDPKLAEKKTVIDIQCESGLMMDSYPGAFAQIITNFTVNSIMHGFKDREGGTITINAKAIDGVLHFDFKDDGCGMTDEVQRKCFDPFFTTNMQLGTGLGLNIVYNLVTQKLHGEISCSSTLESYSCFSVRVQQTVPEKIES